MLQPVKHPERYARSTGNVCPPQAPDEIDAAMAIRMSKPSPRLISSSTILTIWAAQASSPTPKGEVVQHIEYVPYGEVFIEERNNVWNSPYLFNAKEFDEETGLYYYGARYYDPRLAMWYGVDPMAEKYPSMGAYVYCANNPVKLLDPDGRRVKPSELLNSMGIEVNSFAAGLMDGLVDASPIGIATFAYDLATDENFRTDFCESIQYLVENPIDAISSLVESKVDTYSEVFQGNATEEQKYEVGNDLGNIIGTVLTGSGIKSIVSKLKQSSKNVIYFVPGEATVSGKPYIGRTNNLKRRMRECKDGRDRTKAIIIDHYDPNIPKDGAIKEQKAINKYSRGKLNNLDNKRNEIKKSYWAKYGIE